MLASSTISKVTNTTKSTKVVETQKKIDTGMTKNDVVFLNNHQVAQRKSEIFRRISAKKLKLLLESDPLDKSIVRQNENE